MIKINNESILFNIDDENVIFRVKKFWILSILLIA